MLLRLILGAAILATLAGTAIMPLLWRDETHIVDSVTIARAPADVFAYVTTPANWPKWHPSSLAVRGATGHPLAHGEQVTEDFVVAGRRGTVVWSVALRDAPRKWIIKGEVGGHAAGSVTYTLTLAGEATRFTRELAYPSRNLLFVLLNRLSIRQQVEAESAQAVHNLKQILEARSS